MAHIRVTEETTLSERMARGVVAGIVAGVVFAAGQDAPGSPSLRTFRPPLRHLTRTPVSSRA